MTNRVQKRFREPGISRRFVRRNGVQGRSKPGLLISLQDPLAPGRDGSAALSSPPAPGFVFDEFTSGCASRGCLPGPRLVTREILQKQTKEAKRHSREDFCHAPEE